MLLATVVFSLSHGTGTSAAASAACDQKATVIGVRGSGDPQGGDAKTDKYNDEVHGMGKPGAAFAVDLANDLPRGEITFLPVIYPAVGLLGDWRKIVNAVGAGTHIGFLGAYNGSVNDGKKMLRHEISDEERLCPNLKLVLVGYSQGAQIVADVFQRDLSAQQQSKIIGLVVFGDPYFNPLESDADRGSFDPTRHGALGTRRFFPTTTPTSIWSVCHKYDPICQGPGRDDFSQHTNYQSDPLVSSLAAAIAGRIGPVTSSAGTKIVGVRPVDKFSRPLPQYHVSRELNGGQCEDGSDQVGPAYRCFSGNGVYDPCWAEVKPSDAQTPYVLCMGSPWDTNVVEIRSPTGLGTTSGSGGEVWGVKLSDGTKCVNQDGAVDSFQGKAVRYYCGDHTYLLDTLSRSTPVWTIEEIHADASYHYSEVGIKKIALAWEGLPNQF